MRWVSRDDLIVILAAATVAVAMIVYGHGIPYVLDGNETFSSIVHARNLLHYDFSVTKGLADETASTAVSAHAFVHTHQGNFPRLFAALLFLLGASSPEAQIAVTSLTVGVAAILLLFRFFRLEFGRAVAFVATFLLLTDYVMFLQWHIVTYRVWHGFFLGSCLYSVSLYARTRDRRCFAAFLLLWACLFYYEIMFAVFTAIVVGLWTIWSLRRDLKAAAKVVGLQFLGCLSGVGAVLWQLTAYLGWDGFLKDLSLTYGARNDVESMDISLQTIKSFMDAHHIVFFENIIDGTQYRSLSFFLDCLISRGLSAYSVGLALMLTIAAYAFFLDVPMKRGPARCLAAHPFMAALAVCLIWLWPGVYGVVAGLVVGILAMMLSPLSPEREREILGVRQAAPLWVAWIGTLTLDRRVLGEGFSLGAALPISLVFSVVLGTTIAWSLERTVRSRGICVSREQEGQQYLFILFCSVFAGLFGASLRLWVDEYIGSAVLPPILYHILQRIGLIWVSWVAAYFLLVRPSRVGQDGQMRRQLLVFLVIVLAALMVIVLLIPGYLYSGYMVRGLNFMVPLFAPFPAVGLVWLWTCGRAALRRVEALPLPAAPIAGIAGGGAAVLIVACWLTVQGFSAAAMPAGRFADLLRALRAYPGASVVSNSYALPFHVATGGWAYLDQGIGGANVRKTPEGYEYVHRRSYLWFADRDANPDYTRPDLYVCYNHKNLKEVYYRAWMAKEGAKWQPPTYCETMPLVALARRSVKDTWPAPRILAEDAEGGKTWIVVALDYDTPPFLGSLPQVAASGAAASGVVVDVSYGYVQQNHAPEDATRIAAFTLGRRNGTLCAENSAPLTQVMAKGGQARLSIPSGALRSGQEFAVGVEPRSATRTGEMTYILVSWQAGSAPKALAPCLGLSATRQGND